MFGRAAIDDDSVPPELDGDAALAAAGRLEAQGRLFEAIEALVRANRAEADPRLEHRLVRLRRAAFEKLTDPQGEQAVPRERSLASDASGLPVMPASELEPGVVRYAIERHGSLIVRRLFTEAQAAMLREAIDRALATRDAPERDPSPWYAELEDIPNPGRDFSARGGVHAADSPRGLFQLLECFADAGIGRLVAEYFGERPAITFQKCMLRRAQPGGGGSWHQDGAFLGTSIRALNVWVSLSTCGRTAPGLDVIPRRAGDILPKGGIFSWDIGGRTILERFGALKPARPIFEPGDALLFDHLCVHRTAQTPEMTLPRYAIEAWFFPPSAYPEGRTGLVL